MSQSNETRRAGGAAGLGKLSFPGGIDNRRYPTKNTAVQEQSKARLNYLARGIHSLGPAALGYPFAISPPANPFGRRSKRMPR